MSTTRAPRPAGQAAVPPHDADAERSVIGSILIDPAQLPPLADLLRPCDFHLPAPARVWQEILAMRRDGVPVDSRLLVSRLEAAGAIGRDVTVTDLADMAESVPTASNAAWYADVVARHAERRRAWYLADRLKALATGSYRTEEDHARFRREIEGVAGFVFGAPEVPATPPPAEYAPFPVDSLPEPLRSLCTEGAAAIGCDPSFVALPLLSACAAAIGNSRRVELKGGWTEPAIVWSAVVAESGTAKSPPFRLALAPIHAAQEKALQEFDVAKAAHDQQFDVWQADKKKTPKPAEPILKRFVVADTTLEALARKLEQNPRGLLLARDELSAWFASHNQYKAGKGGDVPAWLSIFSGHNLCVDRVNLGARPIYVPRASVSICGTVQPGVLARCFCGENRQNGLAARFLLAMPPRRPKVWSDLVVSQTTQQAVAGVVASLYALEPEPHEHGERPRLVKLSAPAKRLFIAFANAHNDALAQQPEDLAAVFAKLEAYAARLALIFHLVREASGEVPPDLPIGADSVADAVTLVQWFAREAERVYSALAAGDSGREDRRLVDWITHKHGGEITARELQQGRRDVKSAEQAEAILSDLVKCGYGEWQGVPPTKSGGRGTRVFRVGRVYATAGKPAKNGNSIYKTPKKHEKKQGSVDVDIVDTVGTDVDTGGESEPDWGAA